MHARYIYATRKKQERKKEIVARRRSCSEVAKSRSKTEEDAAEITSRKEQDRDKATGPSADEITRHFRSRLCVWKSYTSWLKQMVVFVCWNAISFFCSGYEEGRVSSLRDLINKYKKKEEGKTIPRDFVPQDWGARFSSSVYFASLASNKVTTFPSSRIMESILNKTCLNKIV